MRTTGATDPHPGTDDSSQASPRRAVEGATLVIIAAAVVAVAASSWPIALSWLGDDPPTTAKPGIARALRSRGWAVGTPRSSRQVSQPEKMQRREASPDHVPDLDPLNIPEAPEDDSLAGKVAKPLTIVQLLDRADPDGQPVISVNPNETLVIVREMTPWVLCAVKRDGKMEFGWTTRSQVAVSR